MAFDRTGELGESELRFAKDDVLYVDNTMFTGTPGLWRAWTLDEYGHRISCGLIPSQSKSVMNFFNMNEEFVKIDEFQSGRRS